MFLIGNPDNSLLGAVSMRLRCKVPLAADVCAAQAKSIVFDPDTPVDPAHLERVAGPDTLYYTSISTRASWCPLSR